jgi:hypothetical protein
VAIQQGHAVIIENVGEELSATLDPVLSRAVYTKGHTLYLKVGGEEIEYDQRFKLYLQTKLHKTRTTGPDRSTVHAHDRVGPAGPAARARYRPDDAGGAQAVYATTARARASAR